MKIGQLAEHNVKNIFLKTSYTKFCGETSLRPFSKKPKMSILLNEESEIL